MVNFKTEKVTDRITRIYGICTELMYLVEGDEKAALLDTGSGFGSLKAVIDSLTDKPVIVLLTHGHTDHAMGAGEFENVYMNHDDDYIYRRHSDREFRLAGLELSDGRDDFDEKTDYIETMDLALIKDMKQGDRFDIGGEVIEIFGIPGHTRGSVAMLMHNARILLTGDSCNGNTFMFEDYSLPIEEYRNNLIRLNTQTEGLYDKVVSSHGDGRLPADIINNVIAVCDDIMAGRSDDIPFEFMGDQGLIAKAVHADGNRVDGITGNIVYSKEGVFRSSL